MARHECIREAELLEALQSPAWPDGPGGLQAHLDACESCREIARIVTELLGEQRFGADTAQVPSSATVWWRMQLRARREASASAMRPIGALQGLAAACGAGLLLAVVGSVSPTVRRFGGWVLETGGLVAGGGGAPAVWEGAHLTSPLGIGVILAATLLLVVAPLAVYLTLRDE